jgi:SAM-dependent methyltransferase
MSDRIFEELDIEGLRASFLEYTRAAFDAIPRLRRPRILEVGCGSGAATIELARLSDGEITAIDPDGDALEGLHLKIREYGLSSRVRIVRCSIFETGIPAATFDIVWEEGVFHLLETDRVVAEAARLVVSGGYLVMFETDVWLESALGRFTAHGFRQHRRISLPSGAWWRNYYGPLEERVARLKQKYTSSDDRRALQRFEGEISQVKADVPKTDCSFLVMQRLQS